MAQNYEIDIKRFNGQDYDTLLPTPASHASTHQANGSDPLTLQEGNYGNSSIPTSAYQNTSVTRAKLAQDALYSPMVQIAITHDIALADLGKTLVDNYANRKSAHTVSLTQPTSTTLPIGFEVAIASKYTADITINFNGVRVGMFGEDNFISKPASNGSVKMSGKYGMVAMKKVEADRSSGDLWLVTGNVEVVS